MTPQTVSERPGAPRPSFRSTLLLAALVALPITAPIFADEAPPTEEAAEAAESPADARPTAHREEITVTATGTARPVREVPGKVDVVTAEEIERLGHTGVADLVTFMPGVAVEGDPTRLGTNGFTIRGVGGNRVQTQIDGIETSEQFDFGPFSVTQFAIDLDALESVEVVRSAGSALYGSDALGGVVSLRTRSPRSILGAETRAFRLRSGWDGRSDELSESGTMAFGSDRWQTSLMVTHRDGEGLDNQGDVRSMDGSRTAPNPIDRERVNVLAKVAFSPASDSNLEATLEWFDSDTETEVFTGRNAGSPFGDAVLDLDARDTQERVRFSLEQSLVRGWSVADSLQWRLWTQTTDTEQATDELRRNAAGDYRRDGLLTFEQDGVGATVEARKAFGGHLLTWGGAWERDEFDQIRDRRDLFLANDQPVPTTLSFPSKYFPSSELTETAVFAQGELSFFGGQLKAIAGLRFDRYDLDADQNDRVFLDGNPGTDPPVDITDEAVSPKLGLVWAPTRNLGFFAQYARGFRAPPMNEVNNGFTNQGGGYKTLPNPDLEAETSDNFELGIRGSGERWNFSVTAFDNRYEDFIELATVGFNPSNFLIEFQSQNVAEVSIDGFELAGDVRFGDGWRLRGAYTASEGTNDTTGEPLESISPDRLVTGLRFMSADRRWGAEAIGTFVSSKGDGDLPSDSTQFRAPSSSSVDLAGWFEVTEWLTLQVTGWNLTDETIYPWTFVRGQSEGSATIDRTTAPGRSFGAQARLRF